MTEQRKGCSEHSTCAAASEAGKNPQYESNIPKTRRYRVWNAKHQRMAGKRRERTEETRLTEATIAAASSSPHGEERRELRLKPRGRDLCARWFPSSFETRCFVSLLRARFGGGVQMDGLVGLRPPRSDEIKQFRINPPS